MPPDCSFPAGLTSLSLCIGEAVGLALVVPSLLFPTVFPTGTVLALVLLVILGLATWRYW